jgi:plastocyanin
MGQAVTLTNADVTSHDIVSKASRPVRVRYGKRYYTVRVPLFRSELAPSGAQKDVKGVASLKPGSYEFFCSLHTAMKGTLIVQEAG